MHPARAAAALVAVGFVACSSPAPVQGHESDTAGLGYTGPYAIDSVQSKCTSGSPDAWDFTVHTKGWADHVTLTLDPPPADTASTATSEQHPLDNVDYDPNGTWDQWAVTLLQVQNASEMQPGATTEFGCADKETLAFLAVMYQTGAPDTVADCAWWGADPIDRFGSIQGKTCTCMNTTGDCTN